MLNLLTQEENGELKTFLQIMFVYYFFIAILIFGTIPK